MTQQRLAPAGEIGAQRCLALVRPRPCTLNIFARPATELTHRAYRPNVVVFVVVPARAVRKDVPSVAAVLAARRRRPIVTVRADVVEHAIPGEAGSGEEDCTSITTCKFTTIHPILSCPNISCIVQKLTYLGVRRCGGNLSEFVVATVFLRRRCPFVAASPLRTTRQPQVYPVRMVAVRTRCGSI